MMQAEWNPTVTDEACCFPQLSRRSSVSETIRDPCIPSPLPSVRHSSSFFLVYTICMQYLMTDEVGYLFPHLVPLNSFFSQVDTCCQSFFLPLLLPEAPQYIVVYSSCRSFWLCYVGCCLNMAWWAVPCPHPGSELVFTLGCQSSVRQPNHSARGWPHLKFLKAIKQCNKTLDKNKQLLYVLNRILSVEINPNNNHLCYTLTSLMRQEVSETSLGLHNNLSR